jgi:hypothetical protein
MRNAVPMPDAGSPKAALALLMKSSFKSEVILERMPELISSSMN